MSIKMQNKNFFQYISQDWLDTTGTNIIIQKTKSRNLLIEIFALLSELSLVNLTIPHPSLEKQV